MKLKATLIFYLALSATLVSGQNFLMDSTLTNISTCGGFFMDSGGGDNPYGPNQSLTTTICPDGSSGTHIQLVFSGPALAPGDDLCFFDGTDTNAPSLGCASDFLSGAAFIIQATAANTSGCLTITFQSNGTNQNSGWSADINCIPACQTILSVVESTDPAIEPVDTGWIDICPGDQIFFTGRGEYPQNNTLYSQSDQTASFEWNLGDGNFSEGPSISHVYEEPGGYIVQLKITDQLGCNNTNFISQRIRVAPRPNFEIGDYTDQVCAGDTVNLTGVVNQMNPAEAVSVLPASAEFQTSGVRSDSLALPDGNGTSYCTSVFITGFSPGQMLTDINDILGIWVNMEHSWMRDLEISLTCPNGQSAILHNHPGQTGGEVHLGIPYENDEGFLDPVPGSGYDYGWQVNPDYNATWIEYVNTTFPPVLTLPSGSYESYEPLTNFEGCPLNGEWEICITDLWPIDNGFIFSWSIDFDADLYPVLEMFEPQIMGWSWKDHPSVIYNQADSLSGTPANAGEMNYTFLVTDEFGCTWDTTVQVEVLPSSHPDCYECTKIIEPVPDTTICIGESIEINVEEAGQLESDITFESYDEYVIGAGNHPPANPYYSDIIVNSITPAIITNPAAEILSVCVDLDTDVDSDIRMYLRAPNGQTLELTSNNGGTGDNYTQTCFTPVATTPIQSGTPPFTGVFQPEGNWNVLNNAPVNGTWSLRIEDLFGVSSYGMLNWWSITFVSKNEVSYFWTPPGALSCDNCPDPKATPDESESYYLTATDLFGCETRDTVSVNVIDNFDAPVITCQEAQGGEIWVNWNDVAPGMPYEININGAGWQVPNNGMLSHVIDNLLFGDEVNIEVRVNLFDAPCQIDTGNSFCEFSFCPLVIDLNPAPPYSVSCTGVCDVNVELLVSNGTAPFTFEVTNQTTGDMFTQTTGDLTNLCAGDYQVLVTDATLCTETVSFTINDQPAVMVTAVLDNPVSCFGGTDACVSASASGGNGPYTYMWNDVNQSTGNVLCNLPAGTYIVTAMDMNGCTGTATVEVTEPPEIVLDLTKTDVNCLGGDDGTATVVANGGTPPYSYQWSGGNTPGQSTTGNLTSGNYSVTVEDANGCQQFGDIDIVEPTEGLELTAVQSVISCFGENNSEATALPMGGTPPYQYLWTPSFQNTPTATNLPVGNFTVVVTDALGCTAEATVALTQWDPIDISLAGTVPSCFGLADGEIAANIVNGGAGGYSFLWNTGDTDDFINGVQGGLTYTVTVTDMQGCTGTQSRMLTDPPQMELEIDVADATCQGLANGSAIVTNVLNNNGMVSYQWDANANSQTTPAAGGLSAGTYNLVVTDTAGCTIAELVTIEEPPAIEVSFVTTDNECAGDENGTIDMEVTGGAPGYIINWSNGANSEKLINLPAGTFYVTITDGNGCERIDSVIIEEPLSVNTNLEITDVSCFGDRDGAIKILPIGGIPPYTYSLNGDNFFGSSTFIALRADEYTVYIRDSRECIYATVATVNEPPELSVSIVGNGQETDMLMISEGETILLEADIMNAQGLVSYNWSAAWCSTLTCGDSTDCALLIDCEMPVATPDYANDYFLTITDEKGCTAEDLIQVQVKKERSVVVPTGFTPNGDANNDLLLVHGQSGTRISLFQVFDRWGELLYQDLDFMINDTSRGWDGQFKSQDMPSGVYVWYVEVEYSDGMTESFKGETTLVR